MQALGLVGLFCCISTSSLIDWLIMAVATQRMLKTPMTAPSGSIKVSLLKQHISPSFHKHKLVARADIPAQTYYQNKIEAAELDITKKTQNLRRLEAQRNALNTRGQCWKVVAWWGFTTEMYSTITARGAASSTGAWELCRGSGESDGEEEGFGESSTRRQIR